VECPTRLVRQKADGTEALINVSDFDPALHEDPSATKPEAPAESAEDDPAERPTKRRRG